jgi:anthranilate phosphoribosyltransferase
MLKDLLKKVINFQNLDTLEAYNAMKYIMEGKAGECEIAAFLTALKMKNESIDEVTGFSRAMLEKAERLKIDYSNAVDTCGTGGDCKNTFNISTTAAFIASGAGAIVAKHGNRSVSSKSGSADVLEALGVNINLGIKDIEKCINSIGIGFIFAPVAHTAMKYVSRIRKEIGIKTVFNILGPITNPAFPNGRVLGVFDDRLLDIMTYSLKNLGIKRAFVVYGKEGLDEISVCGDSIVSELNNGRINKYIINPIDFGLNNYTLKELQGGDAGQNARILIEILSGREKGAKRASAILNAAAAIVAGSKADTLEESIRMALRSIESGTALEKLESLIKFTNNPQSINQYKQG